MQPLRQIRNKFREVLSAEYGSREADALFYWAAQEILRQDRVQIAARLQDSVSAQEKESFAGTLVRLQQGEPIQYIFQKAYFLDLELEVNRSVLIPRGETEELVLWALDCLRDVPNPKILDLCTGSGAIALALAQVRPDAQVWACDISCEALQTAERNNKKCRTAVKFFQQDILQNTFPETLKKESFDLIISNPPYVRQSEKPLMRANVLQYEPHLALFVEDLDPLLFYRRIAAIANLYLQPGASLMAEINEALSDETKQLFEKQDFVKIEIRQDLHAKPRMIKGCKNISPD